MQWAPAMSRDDKSMQSVPWMEGAPLPHPLVEPGALPQPEAPARVRAERSEPHVHREPSQVSGSSVMIFDPYSRQVLAYSKCGDAAALPDLPLAEAAPASRAPVALRLLQLALLSSLALLIWFMLSLL
jgi:hypothetical protein